MKNVFVFLAVALTLLGSCKKEYHVYPVEAPEKLIIAHVWQVQKLTSSQGNMLWQYERGGQNNNFDYDNDLLDFDADGTGTYSAGHQYEITWEFTNAEKSELTYVIKDYANGAPAAGLNLAVKLENIRLTSTTFRYAEIYTNENGVSAVSSVYRTPFPTK